MDVDETGGKHQTIGVDVSPGVCALAYLVDCGDPGVLDRQVRLDGAGAGAVDQLRTYLLRLAANQGPSPLPCW